MIDQETIDKLSDAFTAQTKDHVAKLKAIAIEIGGQEAYALEYLHFWIATMQAEDISVVKAKWIRAGQILNQSKVLGSDGKPLQKQRKTRKEKEKGIGETNG